MDLVHRHTAPVAMELLEHFPCLVIQGARQVGKSTLAAQIMAPDAVMVTLDDADTRDAAEADPAGFVAQSGSGQLVIDEVQRLPRLTLAIKAAVDRDRRPGQFILTGSSSLLRVRGTADSLAGRAARLNMYGLSRGERIGTIDDFASACVERARDLPRATFSVEPEGYAGILAVGAYPEVRHASERMRAAWVDSYLEGLIGRDISELRKSVEPTRVMSLLRALAGRQSAELVKAPIAEAAAVPASTITGYLDLIHDVGLIASIPPWTPSITKREIGRPKTIIIDSALALRLGRLTPGQLNVLGYRETLGMMLESFVAAELLRQRTWSNQRYEIFHYRDRDGDEVDLILEFHDGTVLGIEVRAARSFGASQFKGLTRLRDRLGERFVAGVVLNTGTAGYRYSDRLYGAPISALWEYAPAAV